MELYHDAASLQAHAELSSPRHNRNTRRTRHPYIWMLSLPRALCQGWPLLPATLGASGRQQVSSGYRNILLPSSPLCFRDEAPQGGRIAHHTPLPPSHLRLLLAFQHISVQEITALVSMETPSQPPPPRNVCNIVGLVWQQWSRLSCYPIPSWATSSCFPPKPSSPLLVAVAKAALVSGNPVWREDFCCQRSVAR